MRWCFWVFVGSIGLTCTLYASEGNSVMRVYLEQAHALEDKDIAGRLTLAQWCGEHNLQHQRAELLIDVLKLEPKHPSAYGNLLDADGRRQRPVEKGWAAKLAELLGPSYALHHGPHYTLVTDCENAIAQEQLQGLEAGYTIFYQECAAIGLRPMPPAGRLVAILFSRRDAYRDYMARHEMVSTPWSAGYYSWKTNRAAFFHDLDNPAFNEIRTEIANLEKRYGELAEEWIGDPGSRGRAAAELPGVARKLNTMQRALGEAARLATLGKMRHEGAHQLFYNSGLMARGREYPFWLSEGLATCFELCNAHPDAGPRAVNQHRLKTFRLARDQQTLIGLEELIRYEPGAQEDEQTVADRYAQAWSLAHYLWTKQPERFSGYLAEAGQSGAKDWAALFRRHFMANQPGLERQWRQFADDLQQK